MSAGRLSERVAWVSGAASGIGRATALRFAAEGAAVAVVDRDRAGSEAIATRIVAEGGRALVVTADVALGDEVERSVQRTVEAFGGLDVLVNAAGIVLVKPLHETTDAEWSRVMDVNVRSMAHSLRFALPHLRASRRAAIVNVGSISGDVGQAGTPVYTASKHAVRGLTRSIALDYAADGVRCNCVCPGITDTPMLREHLAATGDAEGALRRRLRRVPSGRVVDPAEVAAAILYLASDDASGITGTSLTVDGGLLAAAEWDAEPRHAGTSDGGAAS